MDDPRVEFRRCWACKTGRLHRTGGPNIVGSPDVHQGVETVEECQSCGAAFRHTLTVVALNEAAAQAPGPVIGAPT